MKNKPYLTKQLISMLLISTVSIFLIGQLLLFYFNYKDSKRSLENNLKNHMHSVSYSLTEALWDYDYEQIDGIGEAAFLHREVAGLVIIDDLTGVVFERKTDLNEGDNIYQMEHAIIKDGKEIGLLIIKYTDHFFIKDMILKLVVEVIIYLAILAAVLYVVSIFTQKVVAPIKLLSDQAKDIHSNLDEAIAIDSSSIEVDQLIQSFSNMKKDIKDSTEQLEAMNENLEVNVASRTKELNEKNNELNQTIMLLKDAELKLMRHSKLELTQQLVSGIAHEINTPLGNAVTLVSYLPTHLEGLKNETGDSSPEIKKIEEALDHIGDALNVVVELMSRFKTLDFRSNIAFEKKVPLKNIIKNSISLLHTEGFADLHVEIDCDDTISLKTKPFVLMEVIKQLSENAYAHAYTSKDEKSIRISCYLEGDDVIIVFEDFGTGMDDLMLNKAFTPFSKESQTSEGSGIGLSIVENLIVNGLHGEINCKSEKGVGTTFEITLKLLT